MINKVTLIGRAGKDPDVRTTEKGVSVAAFSLATSESYKDQSGQWNEVTEWHNVVVWRDLADRVGNNVVKGDRLYVEGKITYRSYDDKEGVKKYVTEIIAQTVRRLDSRDKSSADAPAQTQTANRAEPAPATGDDLPF